jgi:hypothetical protein
MVRVTPPRTNSRHRECPYPPITMMSAEDSAAWDRSTLSGSAEGDNFLNVNLYPVTGQVMPNIRTWYLAAFDFIANDDDFDRFSTLQKRDGVASGAGCAAAAIPTHQNAVKLDAASMSIRHHQNGTPAIEQSRLDN